MTPAWVPLLCTVLGIVVGVVLSHVTLGRHVERSLVQLEDLTRRVGRLEAREDARSISSLSPLAPVVARA